MHVYHLEVTTVLLSNNNLHFLARFSSYGVDREGQPPVEDNSANEVVVPETNCPLSPTQLAELHALYDIPLSPNDNFSINLLVNVLQFVENNVTV